MTGDTDDEPDDDGGDASDFDPAVTVRRGREGDLLAVLRIIEGAMLEVGANQVRRRTQSGEVLVATRDGQVVGALVRDGEHVEAIAVHPDRRRASIGRRLIEAALADTGRLTAEFREVVRPFYEKLDFEIEEREERLWGERDSDDGE